MNVLVVTGYYKPAYVYGGPAKSVAELCEGMTRAGANVTVYTTDANGKGRRLPLNKGRNQCVDGVDVHYFPVQWPLASVAPFYSSALARACESGVSRFDVVYLPSTWTYAMWAGATSALSMGVPYVVSPRGSFMTWSLQQKALKKRIYLALIERRLVEHAAAIHVTTELERRQQEALGFSTPVRTIPNGIDVQRYPDFGVQPGRARPFGLPTDSSLSLFVGRLHPMKRLDVLIEAFARVASIVTNAHLVIAGPDDGCANQLKRQVEELGLSERIAFLGLVAGSDLAELYRAADALLLISHRENFGMVLLEAMASRLPVIVSDQVGLAEELGAAGAALVVTGGAAELVDPWVRLLQDAELRQGMGARGRELVVERFSIERVSKDMLAFFQSVAASRHLSSFLAG